MDKSCYRGELGLIDSPLLWRLLEVTHLPGDGLEDADMENLCSARAAKL